MMRPSGNLLLVTAVVAAVVGALVATVMTLDAASSLSTGASASSSALGGEASPGRVTAVPPTPPKETPPLTGTGSPTRSGTPAGRSQSPATATVAPAPATETPRASETAAPATGTLAPATQTQIAPPSQVPATPRDLVVEVFDLQPMRSAPGPDWSATPTDASLTIMALPTAVDRSLRLQAGSPDGGEESCRAFPAVSGATLTVSVDIMVDVQAGPSTVPLISVRGGQDEVASLVLDPETLQAEAWYRVTMTIDFLTRRAAVDVADRDSGEQAIAPADKGWTTEVPAVDRVCFGAPAAQESAGLYIDNLTVSG